MKEGDKMGKKTVIPFGPQHPVFTGAHTFRSCA